MKQGFPILVGLLVVIGLSTPTAAGERQAIGVSSTLSSSAPSAPPTPIFADNYHVHGLLSLPYAELNEPFNAYYDKQSERSRTDYYGGEYQVYQFGPGSAPDNPDLDDDGTSDDSSSEHFGAIYKLLYVPADFHNRSAPLAKAARELLDRTLERFHDYAKETRRAHRSRGAGLPAASRTAVKRACFGVQGGVGFTVQAQTVLPSLADFTFDSHGRCPHRSGPEHLGSKCELWKYSNQVGDKKNSYKFWLRRDEANSSLVIPVHYYMLGYDSLLGSHYDRYDISYYNYRVNGATQDDFKLDVKGNRCGQMPGPGDDSVPSARRAHLVVQNPIHAYVVEPHRYDHIDQHYEDFKSKFGKSSSGRGDRTGWFNFLHNLRFIHGKNRELRDYKLEVNRFADENVRELRYLRGRLHSTGYNGGLDYQAHHRGLRLDGGADGQGDQLPESFDWQVEGAVTPVKDQAVCGSCWSFGTVGTVEGAYFVKTGKLLRLSQQQLVDCSWQFGNNGCDGGEDFRAYQYIMKAGGLATEEDYGHYKGIDGRCHDKDVEKPVKIKGFYNITMGSVEALKHALVNYGPISISIDASRPTFTFYSHGAYYDPECKNSPDSLDHSVLVVGYTKINGKLVWKVKNSWSTYWGNDGYIYMAAENNNCGVLDAPTVPIIDTN